MRRRNLRSPGNSQSQQFDLLGGPDCPVDLRLARARCGIRRASGTLNLHLLGDVTKAGLAGAFTGYWITSLALIALSAPLLWRGGGWLFFLLVSVAFFLFGTTGLRATVALWHSFLGVAVCNLDFCRQDPVTTPTLLALIIAIGVQCYWTAAAIRYDWGHAYSGSLAAAQYLKETGLPSGGFTPLVTRPSRSNLISQRIFTPIIMDGAYWDWSKRNTAGDPAALFASDRRELVLVGYKNLSEKQYWADFSTLLGYGLTRHFEGGTFWQTGVFELESYDLYRHTFIPLAPQQREHGRSSASGSVVEWLLRYRREEIALDGQELLSSA